MSRSATGWRCARRSIAGTSRGEVVQRQTDAVAPQLGREMSALSHAHELEADAFALRALRRFGHDTASALAVFMREGVKHDSATHPGTRKRVAHLRSLGE